MSENDARWMGMALVEARRGIGLTAPNPPVGAVVVADGEVVLGTGWHRRAGSAHAEVEALQAAIAAHGSAAVRGSTLYVTLEPCSTHGRTPPCCEAIVAAGIARVVYAVTDPSPAHAGRADQWLGKAGIEVVRSVGGKDGEALLRPFAKRVTTGIPWVITKLAVSLDGRITRPTGEPRWLSSPEAREDAHRLRAEVDAIVVGAETVRADDPALTIRGAAASERPGKPQPWRVVVTRSGRLPSGARVLTDAHRDRTLVVAGSESLASMLQDLGARGCNAVLVEGGGELVGEFVASGLADEAVVYVAPIWCGAGTRPATGSAVLDAARRLEELTVTRLGPDVRFRGLWRSGGAEDGGAVMA